MQFVSANGSNDTGDGTIANPYATLDKAYKQIASGGTIYVMTDIEVPGVLWADIAKTVTITSCDENGKTGSSINNTVWREEGKNVIHMNSGVSSNITLTNITFDYKGESATAGTFIHVQHGTLTINSGTVFQNNKVT